MRSCARASARDVQSGVLFIAVVLYCCKLYSATERRLCYLLLFAVLKIRLLYFEVSELVKVLYKSSDNMPPPSRQSRHLWVGNLPEDIDKDRITDYFSRYLVFYLALTYNSCTCRFGKVEGVHILPQRYPGQGIAAFVDFYDVHAAVDAVQTAHTISGREIRVNYKFKDGGGGPRFGRHEQSPSRHDKERYGDKKTQRRYNWSSMLWKISYRDGKFCCCWLNQFIVDFSFVQHYLL